MDNNDVINLNSTNIETDDDVIELNLAEYLEEIFAFSY